MTVAIKPRRALATLKLPRKVPDLIAFATVVMKGMTGNTYIPNPTPQAAAVQPLGQAAGTAEITDRGELSRRMGAGHASMLGGAPGARCDLMRLPAGGLRRTVITYEEGGDPII